MVASGTIKCLSHALKENLKTLSISLFSKLRKATFNTSQDSHARWTDSFTDTTSWLSPRDLGYVEVSEKRTAARTFPQVTWGLLRWPKSWWNVDSERVHKESRLQWMFFLPQGSVCQWDCYHRGSCSRCRDRNCSKRLSGKDGKLWDPTLKITMCQKWLHLCMGSVRSFVWEVSEPVL